MIIMKKKQLKDEAIEIRWAMRGIVICINNDNDYCLEKHIPNLNKRLFNDSSAFDVLLVFFLFVFSLV